MPRVTVVGHDASRSGAPIALLTLLRWTEEFAPGSVSLILLRGGGLIDAYRTVVPTVVLGNGGALGALFDRASGRYTAAPLSQRMLAARLRRGGRPETVLANSFASLPTAARLARVLGGRTKLVCWVHELDGVADRVLPSGRRRQQLLSGVDAFAAVGSSAERMLVERMGVSPDRVRIVVPAPDLETWRQDATTETCLTDIDTRRPVILSMGALGPRKGPERFVDVMDGVAHHPARPFGVWVGGTPEQPAWQLMQADIDRLPAETCRLVAATDDPRPYVRRADLIVSTAVEDPFPLAVLEGAATGTPVVGYDSGGVGELLRSVGQEDALIPVGDALRLMRVLRELMDDPSGWASRGAALADHVRRVHAVDVIGPQMWELIAA